MEYICKLDSDLDCPYRLEDKMHCNNNDQCSFCMVEREEYEYNSKGYVRKERWYEKYYKK